MGKRDRKRKSARRTPFRIPKPMILVVCEGEISEPEYLKGFSKHQRNPRVQILIKENRGSPRAIVEFAKTQKKEAEKRAKSEHDDNLLFDEIWCVFDVDEHSSLSDAKQMARDNELNLAVSNPCFELWLLLHFREPPGNRDCNKMEQLLKKHLKNYNKNVDYSAYESDYEVAVQRANRLEQSALDDGDEGRNPSTGFHRLTDSIRKAT